MIVHGAAGMLSATLLLAQKSIYGFPGGVTGGAVGTCVNGPGAKAAD
jgi:hypothetical protein